jgi:hypothetical protein
MGSAAPEPARIYRAVWWSIAAPVGFAGVLAACLSLRLGAVLLVAAVAGLTAFFGWQLSTIADEQRARSRSVAGDLLAVSVLGGVAVLACAGMTLALGAAGCLIAVAVAAAGWPALRRARPDPVARTADGDRCAGSGAPQPGPPPGGPRPSCAAAPTLESPPPGGLPDPSSLGSLSTPELCRVWRLSYLQVQRATGGGGLEQLARLRRGCLEELERRDRAAFDRWLPTARAAGDPARVFCPPARPRPGAPAPEGQPPDPGPA